MYFVTKGSHFDAQLRIALDIICATPPNQREVPIDFIQKLVSTNENLWKVDPRSDEARAILLYKLLHNTENCIKAKECEEVKTYLEKHGDFIPMVSDFEWRKNLYGHESHDILRKLTQGFRKHV